jgi:hypothetical protein
MMNSEHRPHHRLMADHFAGRSSPRKEALLRAHLPGCTPCRHRYERHRLLAELDPAALRPPERLAAGLGLRASRARPRPRLLMSLSLVPAFAALTLLLVWSRPDPPAPRGALAPPPTLLVYQLGAAGPPRLASGAVASSDELAFAYNNPAGLPYLLVFGVDQHRRVFWYHPAWTTGAPPPAPVAAQAGVGPHELPDAVRHRLEPGSLEIFALLSTVSIAPAAVEGAVAAGRDPATLAGAGGAVVRRRFTVVRGAP